MGHLLQGTVGLFGGRGCSIRQAEYSQDFMQDSTCGASDRTKKGCLVKNKKWFALPVFIVLLAGVLLFGEPNKSQVTYSSDRPARSSIPVEPSTAVVAHDNGAQVLRAFQNRQSGVQVTGSAVVSRLLPDDNQGSRHQKFILRFSSGNTLLIAHNIDLAPRIGGLREGDRVEFYGVYEWNDKGGVVHWTHHDPGGRHVGGWLRHNGQTYQ